MLTPGGDDIGAKMGKCLEEWAASANLGIQDCPDSHPYAIFNYPKGVELFDGKSHDGTSWAEKIFSDVHERFVEHMHTEFPSQFWPAHLVEAGVEHQLRVCSTEMAHERRYACVNEAHLVEVPQGSFQVETRSCSGMGSFGVGRVSSAQECASRCFADPTCTAYRSDPTCIIGHCVDNKAEPAIPTSVRSRDASNSTGAVVPCWCMGAVVEN
jgi:hypothetical protein